MHKTETFPSERPCTTPIPFFFFFCATRLFFNRVDRQFLSLFKQTPPSLQNRKKSLPRNWTELIPEEPLFSRSRFFPRFFLEIDRGIAAFSSLSSCLARGSFFSMKLPPWVRRSRQTLKPFSPDSFHLHSFSKENASHKTAQRDLLFAGGSRSVATSGIKTLEIRL